MDTVRGYIDTTAGIDRGVSHLRGVFPRGHRFMQPSVLMCVSMQIAGEVHVFEGNRFLGDGAGDQACFCHV